MHLIKSVEDAQKNTITLIWTCDVCQKSFVNADKPIELREALVESMSYSIIAHVCGGK